MRVLIVAFILLLWGIAIANATTSCSIDRMLARSSEKHLIITSAYRSPKHNKEIGGAKWSWHMHPCGARDIAKVSITGIKSFIAYVLFSGYRVIEYPRHIHIDVDEVGYFKKDYEHE